MTKICATCKKELTLDNFSTNKSKKDGLNTKCRKCFNTYMREWYAKNSETHKARVKKTRNVPLNRAKRYGLTVEQVQSMIDKYDGMCWSCKERPAQDIDHCHITDEVRGILCHNCNIGIGLLGDTLESVEVAVTYLRRAVRTV